MGKTPERRATAAGGALRYRRKVPAPEDNQQPEPQPQPLPPTPAKQPAPKQPPSSSSSSNSNRSPPGRRFRPKPRQPKKQQQQPALLKQLLWKAKAVQPAPASLGLAPRDTAERGNQPDDDEEEEEAAYARQQRTARKLLASEAQALAASKRKAVAPASPAHAFAAESSSQETQSGSEDEAVFLPYNGLPTTKWQLYAKGQEGAAEETDGEEAASPVAPSEAVEDDQPSRDKEQEELEKAAAARRKQRQKYKLKQKQKRAAAKEQKRLQHQQRQVHEQENERPRSTEQDTAVEDENARVDIFHPPTNLSSAMDAGVCRAVLSQLKDVVPFIVVGDVACPVVVESDTQPAVSTASAETEAGSRAAVVDFREHVIAMLDRSKETQMQYRDSFVVENSGFDAASSYDFFKRRTQENCSWKLVRLVVTERHGAGEEKLGDFQAAGNVTREQSRHGGGGFDLNALGLAETGIAANTSR
ncbi:unnamed protein product [Phytophthora fragariaefolia]|uniref:Unnamed protein product n=1 Tax=Phytophthora fragariaefolia TaxID=1490495 RepID=A0A9W7D7R0_9STRA|nr:unnamed protein product [Phytophthora fragariaefolia]